MKNLAQFGITLCLAGAAACGQPAGTGTSSPIASEAPADTRVAVAAPADVPADVFEKAALSSPCLFSNEEASTLLGTPVTEQKPDAANLEAYGIASCRYEGERNTLVINLTWIDPAQLAAWKAAQTTGLAGSVEPVAGDADGAYLQMQPEIGGALHYIRKNVQVEVRPMSWSKDTAENWRNRLLAARRIP